MTYEDLLKIVKNEKLAGFDASPHHLKVLSPQPLESPEDLEKIISSKYRYLGPGKWKSLISASDIG